MKKIHDFIESVYQDIDLNQKEIAELKAEMKQHLLEKVNELQSEGNSEEESLRIAFSQFGDEKSINWELKQMFQVQKKFTNWLLRLSIVFLAIFVLLTGLKVFQEHQHIRVMENFNLDYLPIVEKLEKSDQVTAELQQDIRQLYSKYENYVEYVAIFPFDGSFFDHNQKIDPAKATFAIPEKAKAANEELHPHYSISANRWIFAAQYTPFFLDPNDTLLLMGIGGFLLGYWILFTLWAIITAYHRQRLTAAWAIAFSVLNVFAYLLFRSERTKKRQ